MRSQRRNVSTHSRLKAAGRRNNHQGRNQPRFNTQPPEGGWCRQPDQRASRDSFNTQPPEGGWLKPFGVTAKITVSTHSRLKAAGDVIPVKVVSVSGFNTQPPEGGWSPLGVMPGVSSVSTHSRLKAAGFQNTAHRDSHQVSTHSRLKAAGANCNKPIPPKTGFNTQPPEGGWLQACSRAHCGNRFQHTAA